MQQDQEHTRLSPSDYRLTPKARTSLLLPLRAPRSLRALRVSVFLFSVPFFAIFANFALKTPSHPCARPDHPVPDHPAPTIGPAAASAEGPRAHDPRAGPHPPSSRPLPPPALSVA